MKPKVFLFSTVAFLTTSLIAAEGWPEWRDWGRAGERIPEEDFHLSDQTRFQAHWERVSSAANGVVRVLPLRTAAPTLLIDLGLLASEALPSEPFCPVGEVVELSQFLRGSAEWC